jgi:hypothetical protein
MGYGPVPEASANLSLSPFTIVLPWRIILCNGFASRLFAYALQGQLAVAPTRQQSIASLKC